jgi:hypothetical protein
MAPIFPEKPDAYESALICDICGRGCRFSSAIHQRSMFAVQCSLFNVRCSMFAVQCSLFNVSSFRFPLFAFRFYFCNLFTAGFFRVFPVNNLTG